ncbi:hypothetical protein GCM10025868_28780 [Angustibacter aerolatus]|uniref:CBS domain-containing protein n=1 Tax=Angustibacter aerolatus TaxID=1162965 RepID=A0ABQ6JHF2_9ACTN|nr:CBS domain-containing protein [Angustibacter aerolatus]GMA87628.1 hypothetical protein GCM10025868_28780 [Angustibacter aerolatus]
MRIADVIRRKGDDVVTITPDGTVERLLALLAEHRIGALVVSVDGTSVAGIVSERDVVRALHEHGPAVLERTVGEPHDGRGHHRLAGRRRRAPHAHHDRGPLPARARGRGRPARRHRQHRRRREAPHRRPAGSSATRLVRYVNG